MGHYLEIKNLKVSFRSYEGLKRILDIDELYIDKGEAYGLVGESGSGKSVLALTIFKLLTTPPGVIESGSIILDGIDILKKKEKEMEQIRGKKMAMIFQDPMSTLNPVFTIGQQLIKAVEKNQNLRGKEAYEKALEMISLVKLPDAENVLQKYPHELSGGQRQRIIIAIALSCGAEFLIADEPTTALDVTIQAQIMDLMRELKEKSNTAIILVTHDLGVVANFADRIQVMYAGQVVERGTAREIFYESKHPYTWALLSSVPKVTNESKEELYALKGTPPDLLLPLHECPFASRCEYCMGICKEKNPMETSLSDTHKVSCWLQHPKAPKVKSFYDKEAK